MKPETLISPDTFYETTFQNLVLSWVTLHFVGWVEPTPSFVGFRCTQPNLYFAGVVAKCEPQQLPISELSIFLVRGAAYMKLHKIQHPLGGD